MKGVRISRDQHAPFAQRRSQVVNGDPDDVRREVKPLQEIERENQLVTTGNGLEDIYFLQANYALIEESLDLRMNDP